jgi:ABC-type iron transport system FetAB permease component
LLVQLTCNAFVLARASAGNNIAATIAMMAITTNNSINVKALRRRSKVLAPEFLNRKRWLNAVFAKNL